MPVPKIAIVGAGPAGLTLARLLQLQNMPCIVYEAEADRHSRNQGGTLDLHLKAGQLALKHAGLIDEFHKYSRPEGDCMKIMDKTGMVLVDENMVGNNRPKDLSDRPEINRTDLRNILLDSLLPDTVKWGRKVDHVEVEHATQGIHTLVFTDGSKETGIHLLIAADGAFSKLRKLVTNEEPYYSGITITTQWKLDADNTNGWLSEFVGAGSCFMFDQDRALIAQRQSKGAVRIYAGLRKPHSWIKDCGIDWNDHKAARQMMAEQYFGDCGDDIKQAILESDDFLDVRHLYMLPVEIKWNSKPGVTLMGDCAHLMTPFGGVGVNMAMKDALDLGKALLAHKKGLLECDSQAILTAIQDYEKEMLPRAAIYAQKSLDGLEHHFRATGTQEWAARSQANA